MKKQTKQKRSKKSDNAKLAKGAEQIRKAELTADQRAIIAAEKLVKSGKNGKKKTEALPVVIPESTRPIQEIIGDRVTVLPGHIGLKLADDTPIEESLRVLDWTLQMSDHVGFMVGDVINFGNMKWGEEEYTKILLQTGLQRSTLRGYARVARNIPQSERTSILSFSHYKEVCSLENSKRKEVLSELEEQANKGELPTKEQLRIKVQKLTPKKKKPSKRITSGKGKKKAKPEPPPYEPTPEQQSILDKLEFDLMDINGTLKTVVELAYVHTEKPTVVHLIASLDNREKRRWLAILQPVFAAYNLIERVTGY
jgi:hypothetical protein